MNITDLQPDTKYSVQVAALTRRGDGDRSKPVHVRTPGGVPNRPQVNVKYVSNFGKLRRHFVNSSQRANTKNAFRVLAKDRSLRARVGMGATYSNVRQPAGL